MSIKHCGIFQLKGCALTWALSSGCQSWSGTKVWSGNFASPGGRSIAKRLTTAGLSAKFFVIRRGMRLWLGYGEGSNGSYEQTDLGSSWGWVNLGVSFCAIQGSLLEIELEDQKFYIVNPRLPATISIVHLQTYFSFPLLTQKPYVDSPLPFRKPREFFTLQVRQVFLG